MKDFFSNSDIVDYMVLRPLSHIYLNWEMRWDFENQCYFEEKESFAKEFNILVQDLDQAIAPLKYHDNEDRLAEYVAQKFNWGIRKVGNRWEGADYESILEQGGFNDIDQLDLVLASAGRIKAAKDRDQMHFDEMERSHQKILAAVLSIILYHRADLTN